MKSHEAGQPSRLGLGEIPDILTLFVSITFYLKQKLDNVCQLPLQYCPGRRMSIFASGLGKLNFFLVSHLRLEFCPNLQVLLEIYSKVHDTLPNK